VSGTATATAATRRRARRHSSRRVRHLQRG
jgi:hypothetical protein